MESKLVKLSEVSSLEDLKNINRFDILMDDSTIFEGKKLVLCVGVKSVTVAYYCQGVIMKQRYDLIKSSISEGYFWYTYNNSAKIISDGHGVKKRVLNLRYL
ncbi:MAG: hypothetical protein NTZ83_06235 [Candidatus Pacearchaeota archaeon]|nr:hypothetical protein [Candidatus Pacearchaeota archaeon]